MTPEEESLIRQRLEAWIKTRNRRAEQKRNQYKTDLKTYYGTAVGTDGEGGETVIL